VSIAALPSLFEPVERHEHPCALAGACLSSVEHTPAEVHSAGYTQSTTDLQLFRQSVPAHLYGEQSVVIPLGATSV
jgi:hypothetical protein